MGVLREDLERAYDFIVGNGTRAVSTPLGVVDRLVSAPMRKTYSDSTSSPIQEMIDRAELATRRFDGTPTKRSSTWQEPFDAAEQKNDTLFRYLMMINNEQRALGETPVIPGYFDKNKPYVRPM